MCKCADEMLISNAPWIFNDDVNVLSPMLTMKSTPHSPHRGEFVRYVLSANQAKTDAGCDFGPSG